MRNIRYNMQLPVLILYLGCTPAMRSTR